VAGPSQVILPDEAIARFCGKWGITRLELFGSALTRNFRPDSDLDFLVTFEEGMSPGLNFFQAADELSQILSRKVDLISKEGLGRSRNKFRSKQIFASAQPIYVRS